MRKFSKNLLLISPFPEQLEYLRRYVNAFYLYPRHFHLGLWYIHRIPARIKRFSPAIPEKLLIPLEYIFNPPHRVKGLVFHIDPSIIDAILIVDPTYCNFDLKPFKTAVKIYWSIDNIYESTLYHDTLLTRIEKFDYIFTAHKNSVPYFSKLGPKTYWLPPYYDPEVNRKLDRAKDFDVTFVGNIYGARIGYVNNLKKRLSNFSTFFGTAYYNDLNEIYNRSKIVLNFANRRELNFRTFEVLGSGAFLLNEFSEEVLELFQENVDLVTFSDLDELIDKIFYYLDRDTEREKIASSGHRKVQELHTLEARIKELLEKTIL